MLVLFVLFLASLQQGCYVFDDSWVQIGGNINNSVVIIQTRTNVLTVGARFTDVMIYGNKNEFYIGDYHDIKGVKSLNFSYSDLIFIRRYTFKVTPGLNLSKVMIMQNVFTSNLNITHSTVSKELTKTDMCLSSMGLPGKISSINVWGFIVIEIIYIVIFFISWIYANSDPLKSRSLSLYICCVGCFTYSIGDFLETQFNFQWYSINGCLIDAFLIYPSQQLTFILPLLIYFRYLVLLQINISKLDITDSDDIVSKLRWYHKLFYYATSKNIFICVPIVYLFLFESVMLIVNGISKFGCSVKGNTNNTYIHLIFSAICASGFIILLLIDMIRIIPLLFKCKLKEIIKKDPHYFKLEHLAIILLVVSFVIWASGLLSKTGNMIVIEIAFLLTLLVNGGVSLVITILFDIINRFRKEDTHNNGNINELLDSEIKEDFKNFCKSEYSIENYLCYNDIRDYKKCQDDKRKSIATLIYERYLTPSIYEVNIPHDVKNSTLAKYEAAKEGTYRVDLFDDMQAELIKNLSDTRLRFCHTKIYKNYITQKMNENAIKTIITQK